ncbi:MAG: ferrochelatase [Steroidobacteraceae bacterium]
MANYSSSPQYRDTGAYRTGVLLVNSGTPDTLTTRHVRSFLKGLLGDRRTIEVSRLLWLPILYGIILPLRPRRSARKYRKVWTEEGSPLLTFSKRLRTALAKNLSAGRGESVAVELGMLYSSPGVAAGLDALRAAGAQSIIVLPLFPQYSGTTNAAAFDQVAATLRNWRWLPELRFIADYHDDAAWLDALAASIRAHREVHGNTEHLLMSFHGIPARYTTDGDPYFRKCERSAHAIAELLGLSGNWSFSFQSRVGYERWLEPYTDETIVALARRGLKRIAVVCPGFAVDCLETIEEIALDYGGQFRAAGGEELLYIPALNDTDAHVSALAAIIHSHARQLS